MKREIKYPLTKLNLMLCAITIIIAFVASCVTACSYTPEVGNELAKTARTYDCDYHTISFHTHITFYEDGERYDITGNFVRFLTDPLTLKDKNGNTIGSADDSYHIINQDDHCIIINGEFEVAIAGNFEVFGESYELYDEEGNKVGHTEFDTFGLSGSIIDVNGNTVATYSRMIGFNDYSVTIYDNEICSDKAILMIVASYVSDYHADND